MPRINRTPGRLRNAQLALRGALKRVRGKLQRMQGEIVPDVIVRKVEQQINAEGWMEKIVDRRFRLERESPSGRKWAPLAIATRKDRARKGFGPSHPILQRFGLLKQGAEGAAHGTFRWRLKPVFDPSKIPLEYALIHQFGGFAGRGGSVKIPRRAYFNTPTKKEMEPVENRAIKIARDLVRESMRK